MAGRAQIVVKKDTTICFMAERKVGDDILSDLVRLIHELPLAGTKVTSHETRWPVEVEFRLDDAASARLRKAFVRLPEVVIFRGIPVHDGLLQKAA